MLGEPACIIQRIRAREAFAYPAEFQDRQDRHANVSKGLVSARLSAPRPASGREAKRAQVNARMMRFKTGGVKPCSQSPGLSPYG
jgi:hypothetical protein